MIPPLTQDELHALSDAQLLLRLKILGRYRQELSGAIEGAEFSQFSRRPDSMLRARDSLQEVKTALAATQDEARERLDARAPAITGEER